MARKNLLLGISERKLTSVNSDDAAASRTQRSPPLAFSGRGALGAVTRTIDDLAAKAELAKELEARLASGEVIVDLSPDDIDGSIVIDRMSHDDENYRILRESIRGKGQDSPILVRPHPTIGGRYQVAFGHRRLRAASELGRPVRAVVRQLSDRDLVVAQGQENSARADLSFIERARFARKLETDGYDRETIISSLGVDKTMISRMISVATQIPDDIIIAIGPAPAIGRDRWLELTALYKAVSQDRPLETFVNDPEFLEASSDHRFEIVQEFLSEPVGREPERPRSVAARMPRARGQARYWAPPDGRRVAKITANDHAFILTIDHRVAPGFGDYLLGELSELYDAYAKKQAR